MADASPREASGGMTDISTHACGAAHPERPDHLQQRHAADKGQNGRLAMPGCMVKTSIASEIVQPTAVVRFACLDDLGLLAPFQCLKSVFHTAVYEKRSSASFDPSKAIVSGAVSAAIGPAGH